MAGRFIAYLGEADFHDGFVERIRKEGDSLCVTIKGESGRYYDVIFSKVASIEAERPEGMMLYAISEMSCTPPLRRFVFANWYGAEDSYDTADPRTSEWNRRLEIVAEHFSVIPLNDQAHSTK